MVLDESTLRKFYLPLLNEDECQPGPMGIQIPKLDSYLAIKNNMHPKLKNSRENIRKS